MSHGNARLTFHGRRTIVDRVVGQRRPKAHVAKEMGVSRKTVAHWVGRFETEGESGLRDRSSRPFEPPWVVEAPDLGNEDGVMPKEQSPGKPTTRRYTPEEKAAAVRMVRTLRAELGTEHGTVQRVAEQLGYGVESVRPWVRQADIDDGVTRPG